MLSTYTTNTFPGDYAPTVFENFSASITLPANNVSNSEDGDDKVVVDLSLWDTAGQEDYDRIRPLTYEGTSVFLICYSILNKRSLQNVKDKWLPEVQRHTHPAIPVILVGCKADLREHPEATTLTEERNAASISREEGERVAKEIGALGFFECSALKRIGLKEVFEEAAKSSVNPPTSSIQSKTQSSNIQPSAETRTPCCSCMRKTR